MNCRDLKMKLPSGHYMPLIGLGSYLIKGKITVEVLDRALTAGYRLIDTAVMYDNEADLGSALRELLPKHNLKREDVFITSKLYPSDQGASKAYKALEKSVKELDCGYIDLYLIHWPGTYGVSNKSPENSKLRAESWQCLVEGTRKGLVRDIGVSNYTIRHLEELLDNDYGVKPAVNQVECHLYCNQEELREYCKKVGVHLQAYMPLGGSDNKDLMRDRTVSDIAKKLGKSPAQVLLRWLVQRNISIIPKARSKEHLEENINLDFEIPGEDMETLSSIKKKAKYDWEPETIA